MLAGNDPTDPILPGKHERGITIRDYFAAKAMQGMLPGLNDWNEAGMARLAYEMADAMLAERSK